LPVVVDRKGKGRHADVSPLTIILKEKTMKVRMKKDKLASPDGVEIIDYKKGRTYDMPDELAGNLINIGLATAIKPQKPPETKVEEPDETKVIEPEETKDEEETEEEEEKKDEKPPEPEKKDKK